MKDEGSNYMVAPGSQGSLRPSSTIIVGLGNPILGDDGIGWRVAEEIQNQLSGSMEFSTDIHVECLSLGGLSLMEHLVGYDRAIIIDAIKTGQVAQGSVSSFALESLTDPVVAGHLSSSHDTSLQTALKVGRSMGAHLPLQITIVGIEAEFVYDFSDELTPAIAQALPQAVRIVLDLLKGEVGRPADQKSSH